MKKIKRRRQNLCRQVLCLLALLTASSVFAQEADTVLSYFLPSGDYTYNNTVPKPAETLQFPLGSRHAEWNQVVAYINGLAKVSDRVKVREIARSHQGRPIIEATVSSPENLSRIEQIKAARRNGEADNKDLPVVVSLMYSVHGNEPSGVNSALAVAYFLAAAEGAQIKELLDNTVVVIVPGINPDGINRFASWVNSSRSAMPVSDPNSREFLEPWPSSRTNHYWADCNRDWLMAQHPEGQACLTSYHEWQPDVVADFHEQGPSRHYYFSPGHPKRTHPLTSQKNQELTSEISAFCAGELDKISTLYYSKEGYDDFYYGKGAAYGDIHGSVCLLYEQASTRGHFRETRHGVRTFAWTVRNQAYAGYATVFAAFKLRDRLKDYSREFYRNTKAEAAKFPVKGYVFDTRGSRAVEYHFLENLERHKIEVYRTAKDVSVNGKTFRAADSYIIPLEQKNHLTIRAIMENQTVYEDSIFYDISTWTFPHAFNLNYSELKSIAGLQGEKVTENKLVAGQIIGGKSDYAYLFECNEFYSPKIIYELLKRGVRVAASERPFKFRSSKVSKQMGYGTILVAVGQQNLSSDEIYGLLNSLAAETGVDIYSAETGLMADVDLGSPAYNQLRLPRIAVLVGRGTGIPDSGEIWYLFDKRFQIPVTLIESPALTPQKLRNYSVIALADGVPDLTKASETALKEWVAAGGTLIAAGKAYSWVSRNGLLALKTENTVFKDDSTAYRAYAEQGEASAGNSISGVILNCVLDRSHPLGWGFDQPEIALIKDNNVIFKKDANPYVSPLRYKAEPLLSGFLSAKHRKSLKNKPAVIAKTYEDGAVIVFADDMNFRSYWFGTGKIFLNAVFFGDCIKKTNYNY